MRILHLEASPGWGGQEMRILKEALGLRAKGHDIFFVVMEKGSLIQRAREQGFTVYETDFRKRNWLRCFFFLLKIVLNLRIDVINTHSSLDAWIGGIVGKILKVPVIRTRHLSTTIRSGFNSRLLYGTLAQYVVTTCSSIIPMIHKQSKKPLRQIKCIPTGVNTEVIHFEENRAKEIRERFGLEERDLLVGMVCFMRSWKGIVDFLQAADQLRDHKNIKWVIIGGGHSETYIQMAHDMHLEKIVHFTGHLENPFYAIGALDVFCLLSTAHEGISQASLQAAFLEKPLITTPTGGLGEVCIPEETGIQVPIFSPKNVAEAILTLQKSPQLRKKYGENAKKLVLKKFTQEKMVQEMEKVFQTISSSY